MVRQNHKHTFVAGALLFCLFSSGCGTDSLDRSREGDPTFAQAERELEQLEETAADEARRTRQKMRRQEERLRERAREWKTLWCEASEGMTRRQMRELMGPPTSGTGEADLWDAYGVSVMAMYDTDLRVYYLDGVSGVSC